MKEELIEEQRRLRPLQLTVGIYGIAFGLYCCFGFLFFGVPPIVVIIGVPILLILNFVFMAKSKRMRQLAKDVRELEKA